MFTFESLVLKESDLHPVRKELYHSSGPGYHVIKGFIPSKGVDHMVEFWSELDPLCMHEPYRGKTDFRIGCPNFSRGPDGDGNRRFHNFFWNDPPDEYTHSVAFATQILRNRVEGKPPYNEVFSFTGRSCSYRVIAAKNQVVEPHKDWGDASDRCDGRPDIFDPARLQATLILAEKGKDYGGSGFTFRTNQGMDVVIGEDNAVEPGDLMLWRYNNLHSVEVQSSPGQLGFLRLIFPPELIHPRAALSRLGGRFKLSLKQNALVAKTAIPVYRKVRQAL